MTEIKEIIKREVNPFDQMKLKPMNFWSDTQDGTLTVDSIHQDAITEIEKLLNLVATDNISRTVLLAGDSGSGKSHLLGRLKRTLNSKAFFAYILCNWADSNNIWRHILRSTVDSLIQVPDGEQNSQLMLWLKSLSAFTKRNIKQRFFDDSIWQILQSDRKRFIKHLKDTYKKVGIYNPDVFFGVLHDLTNPELYDLACEWLRGDDLSEESMQELKIKHCIDTEDAAKNILANFGRISIQTQPIVLCFDNLDTMPLLPDGFLDIQPFFNVNTTIHGDGLKNLLVIISVITSTWRRNIDRIQPADKAGIHKTIQLRHITLEQAEALWAYQLQPLHKQANPQPNSPIFPLTRKLLEQHYPGGRTMPRNTLILGRNEYQKYKLLQVPSVNNDIVNTVITIKKTANGTIKLSSIQSKEDEDSDKNQDKKQAEFQLLWQKEYKKNQEKFTKISLISSPDLIQMLQAALVALQINEIKPKLLAGKFASYSLSYQKSGKRERIAIVWTEDASMMSFFNIMNACQTVIQKNIFQTLYLIRIGGIGTPKLAGNQIYQQIFTHTNHHHIKPSLPSVHYLATYQSLVNSALAQELVLAGKTIDLQKLQSLIRESNILQKCILLQDLGIVPKTEHDNGNGHTEPDLKPVREFLFNLITTQGFMGVAALIREAEHQFSTVQNSQIKQLIQELCDENKVKLIDPKAKLQDQLIRLVT